jgi:hypothetical protein
MGHEWVIKKEILPEIVLAPKNCVILSQGRKQKNKNNRLIFKLYLELLIRTSLTNFLVYIRL